MLLAVTALVGPFFFLIVVLLRSRRRARRVLAASLIGAAVASVLLSGSLSSGRGVSDVVGRLLVVALVTVAARAASERLLIGVLAVGVALAAAGPAGPVAGAGLGLAAA
ncbi:MAG: hypothetical protein ACLGI3_15170, partial [Actinomycetes bacterium]